MNPAGDWSNFLVAAAGAAAALTGLIFVAISINLAKILEYPGVSIRASEALIALLDVLLISIVALAPNQPKRALAVEFLAIAGISWLAIVAGHLRSVSFGLRVSVWFFAIRVALYHMALLSFIAAGASLLFARRGAMYWLIPGCVFSFVAGIQGAWVLLIEIVR